MKIAYSYSLLGLILVCGLASLEARADGVDVFLADVGGKIGTGTADKDDAVFEVRPFVFESELEENLGGTAWESDEPGFFGLSSVAPFFPPGASALPPNSQVVVSQESFSIGTTTGDLFFWDGFGAVDFDLPAAGTALSIIPNSSDTTGINGEVDYHPVFSLDDGGGSPAAAGLYLASVSVAIPSSDLMDSNSAFIVFGTEGAGGATNDEQLEAVIEMGVEWVESNLVIPEPSSFILLAVLLFGSATCPVLRKR